MMQNKCDLCCPSLHVSYKGFSCLQHGRLNVENGQPVRRKECTYAQGTLSGTRNEPGSELPE